MLERMKLATECYRSPIDMQHGRQGYQTLKGIVTYLGSNYLPMPNSKGNVKFTLEQATKAQRGSRGIALRQL
jgi:hypothetical protein